MLLKFLLDEDFVNYKKCSMFIGFPYCTFKCDKENNNRVCQNWKLASQPNIEYSATKIVKRYLENPLTTAMVCGGLEPFDSFNELLELIKEFRSKTNDDFIIYTGYNKEEVKDYIDKLLNYNNIYIKFGRYVPDNQPHYDKVLGVSLASDNQYGEKIS